MIRGKILVGTILILGGVGLSLSACSGADVEGSPAHYGSNSWDYPSPADVRWDEDRGWDGSE
jgi:hypothetical protein